jgi:hypothetical protein
VAERLNAADEAKVARAGQREKLAREQELKDLAFVVAERPGRRFIWRQLIEAGIFKTSYDHSGSQMYLNEGMKQHGYRLMADLEELDPRLYSQMALEANQEEAKLA